MTKLCAMTVGSIIQNFSVCTPGLSIRCVVTVRLTLSDVLRSHCRFIVASLEPVCDMMLTTCGVSPSTEMAYFKPSWARTSLRGDRFAHTFTGPAVESVIVYSRWGLFALGATGGAVIGAGSMPAPVRPMPGMRSHDTPFAPTARE